MSAIISALEHALARAPRDQHDALVSEFWSHLASTPLVEEHPDNPAKRTVTFVARNREAHVVLVGINRITRTIDDTIMTRLGDTDIWFRSFTMQATWRGAYHFLALSAPELEHAQTLEPRWTMHLIRSTGELDPHNPLQVVGHSGSASVAELDQAQPFGYLADAAEPRGTYTEHHMPNERRVWLYRPAGDSRIERPLVVLLDGEVWKLAGTAATTVDRIADSSDLRAPLLLFVDNEGSPRRVTDLSIDGTMSDELVALLGWVRTVAPVSSHRDDIMISGESLGGLTALKTVFEHADLFGAAIAQSPSLWQHDMHQRAVSSAPVRLFITAGAHEDGLVEPTRLLFSSLANLHHSYRYVEFDGGHDMAWWRGLWAEGLMGFLRTARQK